MLIQFSVKNYKTFKEKAVLSLVASNYDKDTREEENIAIEKNFNLRILKSAVLYGANASGKSKFMEALMFMKHFVISSSKDGLKGERIKVEPFRLSTETEKLPSEFEVIFRFQDTMFRYGFEVDNKIVVTEWLYSKPKTKEIELFYRDHQTFESHSRNFSKGNFIIKENLVRDNALLISVAAQFNDKVSNNVVTWFKNLKTISGLKEDGYQGFTMEKTQEPITKIKILDLLKAADLAIQDITLQKLNIDELPEDFPKELKEKIIWDMANEDAEFISDVLMTRKKYNKNGKESGTATFKLGQDESSGTKKFFAMTGPILDVLEKGYTLVVDELDSKLHPNLVCKIVSLFNSKEFNKKNAQLIFNTHDTNLLNSGLFRKDQVWFTEKGKDGQARLFSLADFKSTDVKKNERFEDNYIKGKYGAIPYLSNFHFYTQSLVKNEK